MIFVMSLLTACAACLHCMQVGAGKSSVLAALLGELQPAPTTAMSPQRDHSCCGMMHSTDDLHTCSASGAGSEAGGPVVVGRVAYCAQVRGVQPLRHGVARRRSFETDCRLCVCCRPSMLPAPCIT